MITVRSFYKKVKVRKGRLNIVGTDGVGPSTSSLSEKRSTDELDARIKNSLINQKIVNSRSDFTNYIKLRRGRESNPRNRGFADPSVSTSPPRQNYSK